MIAAVITTIQEPTRAVVKLVQKLADCGGLLVVAGDQKGSAYFRSRHFAEGCRIDFLSLTDQQASEFELARKLPVDSYSRKNVAYLHAIAAGVDFLYETDDEKRPARFMAASFRVRGRCSVHRSDKRTMGRLLSLLNEGGIGALHFTYRTLPPGCAFTLKSIRGFLRYLRYRSYVVNGIVNLIQGYSFERPLPIMQMNEYDLSAIHKLLYENKCGEVYTRFTDHGGALGVLLFFRKKSIAPL